MKEAHPVEDPRGDWKGALARHPVLTATLVLCTLAGMVAATVYLPTDWSLARRIAAGAMGGAGTALLITATKLIG